MELANASVAISQITNNNGTSCHESWPTYRANDGFEVCRCAFCIGAYMYTYVCTYGVV